MDACHGSRTPFDDESPEEEIVERINQKTEEVKLEEVKHYELSDIRNKMQEHAEGFDKLVKMIQKKITEEKDLNRKVLLNNAEICLKEDSEILKNNMAVFFKGLESGTEEKPSPSDKNCPYNQYVFKELLENPPKAPPILEQLERKTKSEQAPPTNNPFQFPSIDIISNSAPGNYLNFDSYKNSAQPTNGENSEVEGFQGKSSKPIHEGSNWSNNQLKISYLMGTKVTSECKNLKFFDSQEKTTRETKIVGVQNSSRIQKNVHEIHLENPSMSLNRRLRNDELSEISKARPMSSQTPPSVFLGSWPLCAPDREADHSYFNLDIYRDSDLSITHLYENSPDSRQPSFCCSVPIRPSSLQAVKCYNRPDSNSYRYLLKDKDEQNNIRLWELAVLRKEEEIQILRDSKLKFQMHSVGEEYQGAQVVYKQLEPQDFEYFEGYTNRLRTNEITVVHIVITKKTDNPKKSTFTRYLNYKEDKSKSFDEDFIGLEKLRQSDLVTFTQNLKEHFLSLYTISTKVSQESSFGPQFIRKFDLMNLNGGIPKPPRLSFGKQEEPIEDMWKPLCQIKAFRLGTSEECKRWYLWLGFASNQFLLIDIEVWEQMRPSKFKITHFPEPEKTIGIDNLPQKRQLLGFCEDLSITSSDVKSLSSWMAYYDDGFYYKIGVELGEYPNNTQPA